MSPPSSRSASTDNTSAALIEDFRKFTHKLREQFQGERAHLIADRIRADEVMAEGQELWEKERTLLIAQITALEAKLAKCTCSEPHHLSSIVGAPASPAHITPPRDAQRPAHENQPSTATTTVPSSNEGPLARIFPQESGRNPDGSPFYAPAPQNPSRSFAPNDAVVMRIENMPAPLETPLRETPLRVPAKELTGADFGPHSPAALHASCDASVIGESIDISQLQPELDGVHIKASAVVQTCGGTFAPKTFSPGNSVSPQSAQSPYVTSPEHDESNEQRPIVRIGAQEKKTTLQVIAAPENHRLTMNAGHTPNHSVHKIEFVESGGSTPKQSHREFFEYSVEADDESQPADTLDDDPELSGPLCFENDELKDDPFLVVLTEKLKEVQESGNDASSPIEMTLNGVAQPGHFKLTSHTNHMSSSTLPATEETADSDSSVLDDIPDIPKLRVKASTNFGKPFGRI